MEEFADLFIVAVNPPVIGHIAPFSLSIGIRRAGEGGVTLDNLSERK